jgi:hypothetical protein
MSNEYVKLSPSESLYAGRNLLLSQVDSLTALKRLHEYKQLRKEEMLMKIELRKKIEEAKELLLIIDKLLPRTKIDKELPEIAETTKQEDSIEKEIESIRRKLERLQ